MLGTPRRTDPQPDQLKVRPLPPARARATLALAMAQWTAKYVDELPDSSFAYIEPGGKKDAGGKTVPRSKRHFPIRDKDGKPDAAHVRNAAARATDSPFGKDALPKIHGAEKELKIGDRKGTAALCAVIPPGEPPKAILLIPAGNVDSRDSRAPWINDEPQSAIEASNALEMTAGLPIDYDHATDLAAPQGHPAPAAGWITNLRVQDGAIWGDVEWTAPGAAAVAAGEWKYISPVFDYDKKTRRVTRVLRAALTNNPALYDTAIAAASDDQGDDEMDHDEFHKIMASLFGMPEDSKPEDIHAAAKKHVEAAKKAKAKADAQDGDGDDDDEKDEKAAARLIATGHVVAQKDYANLVGEVNQLKADRAREQAAVKVDAAIRAGRITPGQRDWAIAYCARDQKDFEEFVSRQPAIALGQSQLRGAPPAGSAGDAGATASELAVCNYLTGVTPEEMAARRGNRLSLTVTPQFGGQKVNLSK